VLVITYPYEFKLVKLDKLQKINMATGMSPKERIAFFKKKEEDESNKISDAKPAVKKIGKLDKFEKKPPEEEKKEVKKVIKKKKKTTVTEESETVKKSETTKAKTEEKNAKVDKTSDTKKTVDKPTDKKSLASAKMDEVSIEGELAVNTTLAEGITSPELTSPNVEPNVETPSAKPAETVNDDKIEKKEVVTESKEVTEVIVEEKSLEVESKPNEESVKESVEAAPEVIDADQKAEEVADIKPEASSAKEELSKEEIKTTSDEVALTEEIPKDVQPEVITIEETQNEAVTSITEAPSKDTEKASELVEEAPQPEPEAASELVEEAPQPEPEPIPEPPIEDKPFLPNKFVPLEEDFYNTLFYFSGMGTLIGESVASGIYVNNSTSKRGLSREFLEVEAKKKRVGSEKVAHLVHDARTQANDLTTGLKNLQHLLDSLPTFGDIVDINVMQPNPITPLEGEGPPLTTEETKPVSEIFQEAHEKRDNEMKEIEAQKSQAISKTVSEQYATMQSTYEAEVKLTPVLQRVREVDDNSLGAHQFAPPAPVMPAVTQPPIALKVFEVPAPAPAPSMVVIASRQQPTIKSNQKQQYKLAIEATEKAAARHGIDSTLSYSNTAPQVSNLSRTPLKSLEASQNIAIASHNPWASPAREIIPPKGFMSVKPVPPPAQSSFINYENIKPTIPPVAAKTIPQANPQFGVFDPSGTLAKAQQPQEKENAIRHVNPMPVAPMTNGVSQSPINNTPLNIPSYDKKVRDVTKPKPFRGGYSSGEDGDLKSWQLSKLRAAEVHMINRRQDREAQTKPAQNIPNHNQRAKPFDTPTTPTIQRHAPPRNPAPQSAPSNKPYMRYDAFDNPLIKVGYSDL